MPSAATLPVNQALLTAAAGMRARIESLEVLSNNIANSSTHGYKADREFYRLFLSAYAKADPATLDTGVMPVVEATAIDFRQGPLEATKAPLDLALVGAAFFTVEGPAGPLFTRNGSFHTDAQGVLRTADGHAVLDSDGGAITLPPSREISVDVRGVVSAEGADIAQLGVVEFQNSQDLRKAGGSLFYAPAGVQPQPASRTAVRQGALEGTNVNVAEQAVRLISATRHFQMLTRIISLIGEDMDRGAIDTLGSTS